MKEAVTAYLAAICNGKDLTPIKISKILSERLNHTYPTGWICLIGTSFMANISHEPRSYIRIAHYGYNMVVYKTIS